LNLELAFLAKTSLIVTRHSKLEEVQVFVLLAAWGYKTARTAVAVSLWVLLEAAVVLAPKLAMTS
jgi:hypothetical protein